MSLTEILNGLKKVRDDFAAGKFAAAWEDTLPIQQGLIDLARAVGFQAAPGDATVIAEIHSTLDDCCQLAATAPKAAAGPTVGRLGDGALLAKLLEFLKTVAPIIIPLII
jgi:hypothetical protein